MNKAAKKAINISLVVIAVLLILFAAFVVTLGVTKKDNGVSALGSVGFADVKTEGANVKKGDLAVIKLKTEGIEADTVVAYSFEDEIRFAKLADIAADVALGRAEVIGVYSFKIGVLGTLTGFLTAEWYGYIILAAPVIIVLAILIVPALLDKKKGADADEQSDGDETPKKEKKQKPVKEKKQKGGDDDFSKQLNRIQDRLLKYEDGSSSSQDIENSDDTEVQAESLTEDDEFNVQETHSVPDSEADDDAIVFDNGVYDEPVASDEVRFDDESNIAFEHPDSTAAGYSADEPLTPPQFDSTEAQPEIILQNPVSGKEEGFVFDSTPEQTVNEPFAFKDREEYQNVEDVAAVQANTTIEDDYVAEPYAASEPAPVFETEPVPQQPAPAMSARERLEAARARAAQRATTPAQTAARASASQVSRPATVRQPVQPAAPAARTATAKSAAEQRLEEARLRAEQRRAENAARSSVASPSQRNSAVQPSRPAPVVRTATERPAPAARNVSAQAERSAIQRPAPAARTATARATAETAKPASEMTAEERLAAARKRLAERNRQQ